jgi:hypothetical protein
MSENNMGCTCSYVAELENKISTLTTELEKAKKKEMFQVVYKYHRRWAEGGVGCWVEELKLYDAESAADLQSKLDEFLSCDCSGYHTNKRVISITKL